MYLLNYLYFLIITFLGAKFMFGGKVTTSHPYNKQYKLLLLGPEMFWVLTFSTGLLALSAPAGLDLMALRLLVLEMFCLIGLFLTKTKPQFSLATILYCVYLIWLCIGVSYGPSFGYGVRVILKYLYPLFIMLFASAVVRDDEVFLKSSLWARSFAFFSLIFVLIPSLDWTLFPGVFWYVTARAIHYISIMIFSLALAYYTRNKIQNIVYVVLFLLPCFIWVFRTSIMGSIIAIMVFSFFMYKLRSLPIILGILILGVVAVFTIPSLKEKMFQDQNVSIENFQKGEISQDDVNSNARYAMWEYLENKFYKNRELLGSGTGSVQHYMYNNRVFGGLTVPHSDFVQMRCDNGLIGLSLYFCMIVVIVLHCFIIFNTTKRTIIKIVSITAGASIVGVFATFYSDNVVNYSMATLSMPFGFYGMMLGLLKKESSCLS